LLVAIVGGSGSGKTWLADKLQAALGPNAARLSLDDFYRDRSGLPPSRRAILNFDNPRAIDWARFERVLRQCIAGKTAPIPCYDFKTHCRRRSSKLLKPKPIILIDGLWLLRSPSLRPLFSFSIFLHSPARIRLQRRLARDLLTRGRSPASVRQQFWKTVEPMHAKFVASQARCAKLVLTDACSQSEIGALADLLRGASDSTARSRGKTTKQ
jgi:uridine kinase